MAGKACPVMVRSVNAGRGEAWIARAWHGRRGELRTGEVRLGESHLGLLRQDWLDMES